MKKNARGGGCGIHPERVEGCLDCLQVHSRQMFQRRMTAKKNGGWGRERRESGECSGCGKKNVKLAKEALESGGRMCETCWNTWEGADLRASASKYIHLDMMEMGVPMRGGRGE